MKQLKPKTILAIGLPGSLLANVFITGLIFWSFNFEILDWRIATAILAGSGWLLLSVPIFVGMAFIRHRIGQSNNKQQKIVAAFKYCCLCFVVAALGIGGGFYFRDQLTYQLPIAGAVSFLVGTICVALAVFVCVNILIRCFSRIQPIESQTGC